MSSRSWDTDALVLSSQHFTKEHRNVLLLTPHEQGCLLVSATLFGGARSKLRGMAAAYQTGRVWLYSNPIKNSNKITDFAVSAYRMELRESLVRTWCAAVCSEITIKLFGTVEWRLINAFLDGLCISDDDGCKRGLLRFLWRLIKTAGAAPDIFHCGHCGAGLTEQEGQDGRYAGGSTARAVYSPAEDACFCTACRGFDAYTFLLSAESLGYLYAVSEQPPGYSRRLLLTPAAYGELKRFLFFLTEKMIGGALKTLQTGASLL